MNSIKTTIAIPDYVIAWTKTELDKGRYSGIRFFQVLSNIFFVKE